MNEAETLSHKNNFSKAERLCYNKDIDALFASGESFISYPLRVVYIIREGEAVEKERASIMISVSKKKFKRAVKRNKVKRLIREAYRINKSILKDTLDVHNFNIDVAFLYLKNELPDFVEIDKAMIKAFNQLIKQLDAKVDK